MVLIISTHALHQGIELHAWKYNSLVCVQIRNILFAYPPTLTSQQQVMSLKS